MNKLDLTHILWKCKPSLKFNPYKEKCFDTHWSYNKILTGDTRTQDIAWKKIKLNDFSLQKQVTYSDPVVQLEVDQTTWHTSLHFKWQINLTEAMPEPNYVLHLIPESPLRLPLVRDYWHRDALISCHWCKDVAIQIMAIAEGFGEGSSRDLLLWPKSHGSSTAKVK